MENLIARSLAKSCTYSEFKQIISDLLFEGKSTGNQQSEDLLQYSTLNEIRLKRLDKTLEVPQTIAEKLQSLQKEYIWLVLAEGWCGDAAQVLPILNKMAQQTDKISLRIVFRDANDELMQQYLTNGSRSIPKLLIIDKETSKVIQHWGPRPQGATALMQNYKAEFGKIDEQAKTQLQLWYLKDKGLGVQEEVCQLMLLDVEDCALV